MNVPFTCKVIIEIKCSLCSYHEVVLDTVVQVGDRIPHPALPRGWCFVEKADYLKGPSTELLCPLHRVIVEDL